MKAVFYLALAYLIGSIPFAYIIGKLWAGLDIRRYGSGNVGMTNVVRSIGFAPGVVVLLLDAAKGLVGVYLGVLAGDHDVYRLVGGLAAVAGHNWPIFLRFKGGKGIATSLGVVVAVFPKLAAALILIWLIVARLTRYISVASLTAALLFPVSLWLAGFSSVYLIPAFVMSGFAVYRHKDNIKRLIGGTEYKIGQKARPK